MNQRHKRKHHPVAAEQQIKAKSVFWRKFFPILFAVILAGIPFVAGKYIEFNSPDPFDSAAYVYSAQHIFSGAKIGIDEIPSAQPGTLLVNMLGVKLFGFSELGPKLVQAALQAVALVLMFYTMRKLYGGLAASIGVIIASLYLSAPLIAKFGNVKEQHMIAFMVIGICCYVLRQMGGKWWMAVLAGAALGWAPMFKQTGISAIVAMGIFTVIQPFFRWRSFKQTAADIGLLAGGFVLGVAPVWAWLLIENNPGYLPYRWVWNMIYSSGAKAKLGSYVSAAREVFGFKQQFPQVMRYYNCLILPMAMAIAALFIWAVRQIMNIKHRISNIKTQRVVPSYEKYVPLFGIWWILDAAFVWISPRGYEQYYLPLNASAAMLGGYIFALYAGKFRNAKNKIGWVIGGIVGLIVMLSMGWHIVFGIEVSPFSGQRYGRKTRGYVQRWDEARQLKLGAKMQWQEAGDYIHEHSNAGDGIYVWGWFPGIYLRAERFCPSPFAFESSMHTRSPEDMSKLMDRLLTAFNEKKPKFFVDSRKYEFPYNRPPLPLWPTMMKGRGDFQLIQGSDEQVAQFDDAYTKSLAEQFKDGEAERYAAMKPLRDFIRSNYRIVGTFDQFVVFELKNAVPK
ncbi:MAG: ArnT family glycosyltransferase [Sedimentisphaerales bacterium]